MPKGMLFDGKYVELHPDTFTWGGAWGDYRTTEDARAGNMSLDIAYDRRLLRFAYKQLSQMEPPYLLDIGASTGSFSLLPALIPGARCWSFEPNPGPFKVLLKNIALNDLNYNVTAYNYALSDHDGVTDLFSPEKHIMSGLASITPGCMAFRRDRAVVQSVAVHTLDGVMPDEWRSVGLVKIDAEGSEVDILSGGRAFIELAWPAFIIEYKHVTTGPIASFLCNGLGYAIQNLGVRDLYAWKRPEHCPAGRRGHAP